jgi:uncharacterized protein (TIGR02594 family)
VEYKEFVKRLQREMNRLGEKLKVDGDPGLQTKAALARFDVSIIASAKPMPRPDPIDGEYTHLHPIDWVRGELGQREVAGVKDNPRIRWYHTHSGNIGGTEHPDEVPWCSSLLNAAADECGMEKTDNALAGSWDHYGSDIGAYIPEGAIVTIKYENGKRHVCLANKKFNRYNDLTFEGLGGNQSDMVKVAIFNCSRIVAVRRWVSRPGTITAPIKSRA